MAERIIDWNDHTDTTSAVLRAAREQRGEAAESIAQKAGLSSVHYAKLEQGTPLELAPRVEAIERLCAVLEIQPGDLLPLPWATEDISELPDSGESA
ncbi:hypothetical protein BHE97_07230 [Aeromicrobium sp. PE09-221]|uniref:helix-turn-helix domain-containing protein n=1 Tax=Aeromicrobium sp. PE09-221 TaxID=1898043 RepID=UPI000B3E5318|nr:helix-turn-helix transcriptional regulator [Aeromicrobium sp. PE09-221]OUZ10543.1 hypothetical protein BHE97_07230 [Aeromicrobium sp. PE09-221]